MALVTLCPSCGTTYKIYPEQLQVRNGLVRCGKCQTIFNGFATLITIDESEIDYQSVSVEQAATSDTPDKTENLASKQIAADVDVVHASEEINDGWMRDDERPIEALKHADVSESEKTLETTIFKEATTSVSDFLSDDIPRKKHTHWAWTAANIFLLLLLAGQSLYLYRTDLTVLSPQTKPFLDNFCKLLGCTVSLPENIQLLSIVSSGLEVRDPEHQPEVITLTTIIRNHARYAQALPAVKLYLKDLDNQLLSSRIFTAAQYLPKEQQNKIAIQSGQELVIQLYFDNSVLKSAGYQVQLLY